jgi:ubiquinone/menaquinone biosynthesis C-methylase UbiE
MREKAARILSAQVPFNPCCSFLLCSVDVGTATDRGLRDLQNAVPDAFVCGIEPVVALLRQGHSSGKTSDISVLQGSGESWPFADDSFDVVCEFAILHHVPNPEVVVREMLRVAGRVVMIHDANRFGPGCRFAPVFKLILYKARLWRALDLLPTRGKGERISESDGLFYSYSV